MFIKIPRLEFMENYQFPYEYNVLSIGFTLQKKIKINQR